MHTDVKVIKLIRVQAQGDKNVCMILKVVNVYLREGKQ